jgi:hypothetical protein
VNNLSLSTTKLIILCSSVVFFVGGCSSDPEGPPREGVSGTVSLDGQPLEQGSIQFLSGGTSGGSAIAGGKFSIAREQGLSPGSYRVVINSGEGSTVPEGEMPGTTRLTHKELVPKQYNEKSTLTAEVKAGGPNVFEFTLKK